MTTPTTAIPDIEYPDSDGEPMSDNTLQFLWIMTIQGNLDGMFRAVHDVFVAGNLLWYAVEGQQAIRIGPDVLVAFGRPKGYRGSYMQWREGNVAPHVVFEILSPGNTDAEMERKFEFYDRYGVEEYYLYDPDNVLLQGWLRAEGKLEPVARMHDFVSPRLKIRFDLSGPELVIYRPDGRRFLTFVELMAQEAEERQAREQAEQQAEQARQLAERERLARAELERQAEQERSARAEAELSAERERLARAEAEKQAEQERLSRTQAEKVAEEAARRAQALADRLRALGIDPDA